MAVTPFWKSIPQTTVNRSCLEVFKLYIPEEKPRAGRNAYTTSMSYWSIYSCVYDRLYADAPSFLAISRKIKDLELSNVDAYVLM